MVEETLTGACPSCHRSATFAYVGPQYGDDSGVIHLYNCSQCGSTVSGRRIGRNRSVMKLVVLALVVAAILLALATQVDSRPPTPPAVTLTLTSTRKVRPTYVTLTVVFGTRPAPGMKCQIYLPVVMLDWPQWWPMEK